MSFCTILSALRPEPQHPRTRAARRRAGTRPQLEVLDDRCLLSADVVLEWNQVLLDTLKDDRLLPLYLARDAAIVHAAVYDAVNAIDRSYTPFFADVHASRGASLEAAAAQAAHDTLVALSPAAPGDVRRHPGRRSRRHTPRPGETGHRRGAGRRPADPGLAKHRRLGCKGLLRAGDRPGRLAADAAGIRAAVRRSGDRSSRSASPATRSSARRRRRT